MSAETVRRRTLTATPRAILRLADDDQWEDCLECCRTLDSGTVTVTPNHNKNKTQLVRLRTVSGDGMVHLASFAACERSTLSEPTRRAALSCLQWVLSLSSSSSLPSNNDNDNASAALTAVAGDGGNALHAAVAAASASAWETEESPCRPVPDDSSRDDDSDDHGPLATDEQHRELVTSVMTALVTAGLSPSAPLVDVYGVGGGPTWHNANDEEDDDTDDDNDDDEYDLPYAREAVAGRWNALTLVAVWCGKAKRSSSLMAEYRLATSVWSTLTAQEEKSLTTTVGTQPPLWRPVDFWVVGEITVPPLHHQNQDQSWHLPLPLSLLTEAQTILCALLRNEPPTSTSTSTSISTLPTTSPSSWDTEDIPIWKLSDHFPLPKLLFGPRATVHCHNRTVMDWVCANGAVRSVHWLLSQTKQERRQLQLRQQLYRKAVVGLFRSSWTSLDDCRQLLHHCLLSLSSSLPQIHQDNSKEEPIPTTTTPTLCQNTFVDQCLLDLCNDDDENDHDDNDVHRRRPLSQAVDLWMRCCGHTGTATSTSDSVGDSASDQVHALTLDENTVSCSALAWTTAFRQCVTRNRVETVRTFLQWSNTDWRNIIENGDQNQQQEQQQQRPLWMEALERNHYAMAQLLLHSSTTFTSTPEQPTTTMIDVDVNVNVNVALSLGRCAIECRDTELLQRAVALLRSRYKDDNNVTNDINKKNDDDNDNNDDDNDAVRLCLGRILWWAIDSTPTHSNKYCNNNSNNNENETDDFVILAVRDTLLGFRDGSCHASPLPYLVQDPDTGETALHRLFLKSTGSQHHLRLLLKPLCQFVRSIEVLEDEDVSSANASSTHNNDRNHNHSDHDTSGGVLVEHENPNETPSSSGGHPPTPKPKFSALISAPCQRGRTALHWACDVGCRESVRTLLEFGASPDAVDDAGRVPSVHEFESLLVGDSTSTHETARTTGTPSTPMSPGMDLRNVGPMPGDESVGWETLTSE